MPDDRDQDEPLPIEHCFRSLSSVPAVANVVGTERLLAAAKEAESSLERVSWSEDTLYVFDEVRELVINESPLCRRLAAEQDLGLYHIDIRGWPGCYWIRTMDRDDEGFFRTVEGAIDCAQFDYGEFIVSGDEGQ